MGQLLEGGIRIEGERYCHARVPGTISCTSFRFPPDVIGYAVWLNCRLPPSLHMTWALPLAHYAKRLGMIDQQLIIIWTVTSPSTG